MGRNYTASGNIKVLITGISGFVGTNMMRYLIQDDTFKIIGTSRNKRSILHLAPSLYASYENQEIYEQGVASDAYVHLSGKVYDIRDKNNEDEYYKVNYEATKKLFDHFVRDRKAKKFIFLSTIHVLTENPDMVLDESYQPEPFTPYGKSKYKAEKFIQKHCPPDKDYYILRPSMIHGPGNKGNLNLLYNLVKWGIPYPVGAYNNKRSFVSIENLCFVIKEIIIGNIEKGLYHIADDEPTYTHDLVDLIADATDKKGRIWNVPPFFLELAAKIGNFIPFFINEHRLKKLTGDFIVSNHKIKEAIDKPLPVRSKDGLRKTLNSLRFDIDL
ncbi:MAG: NAD-dependent epimerase/dehydratase family protein [Balneolaceae bacterium]|nr:NAD-dependent epimerase/dehydratase family protein [Balneolaceae bacterium]MDR9409713.1 NAD-dependent epimerase/dehydratase family protein [Balneolaceae bacterium]